MIVFSVFKCNFVADDLPRNSISSKRLNNWSVVIISIFWNEEFEDTETVDVEDKAVVDFSVVVTRPIKSSRKCTTETLWVPLKYDMNKGSLDLVVVSNSSKQSHWTQQHRLKRVKRQQSPRSNSHSTVLRESSQWPSPRKYGMIFDCRIDDELQFSGIPMF